jgi:predicted DNA-binding antitoxin AbrB/MazE fold protein
MATKQSPTLLSTLKKVLARFAHIKRLIVVADRGLLSLDNVDELRKVMLPNGQALELILAVPGRRYGEFAQILKDFQSGVTDAKEEVVDEARWDELDLPRSCGHIWTLGFRPLFIRALC